jgi:hypothetical protein
VGGPGGAARRRPAPAGKFRRAGADSGNARQGRRPRGPREVQWQLDGDRWTGRARSPSSPHGGRRRREAAGGENVGALREEQRAASSLWSTCVRAWLPHMSLP